MSLFTASSMDVQGVSLSTASSMYVQCVRTPFLNAGMSDCLASSQSSNKTNRNAHEKNQSGTGIRGLRTEQQDAGMPMLASLTSMPMPAMYYNVFVSSVRFFFLGSRL